MSRRSSTPYTPQTHPWCDVLVIEVGTPDMSPRQALRLARQVIRKRLAGDWSVEPLGREARDFAVTKLPGRRRIEGAKAWDLAARLQKDRNVSRAEPSFILPGVDASPEQVLPDIEARAMTRLELKDLPCSEDPEWSLSVCEAQAAWNLRPPPQGKRWGEGILIGHPDTGYTDHPEIKDPERLLVRDGYDFEDDDRDASDPLLGMNPSHGTSTASVIMSGRGSPSPAGVEFVSGVAPRSKLIPLRVSTSVIHLSFQNLSRAIYFAADRGHHVVSMSLGGPLQSDFLHRAVLYAVDRGLVLLAAAGNVWPWVVYPARFDEVVAVAACNCERNVWRFSASGPAVDVSAPGESVWNAVTEEAGRYNVHRGSGTSYAVAMVAGACALWMAFHGRRRLLTRYGARNLAGVFKEVLIRFGVDTPPGWNREKHGAGIVNVRKLLQAPLPATPPAGGLEALHASPVSQPTSRTDWLIDYFPGLEPWRVRRVLAGLLRTDDLTLDIVLAEHGHEMAFHIATNPGMRTDLRRAASEEPPNLTRLRASLRRNAVLMSSVSKPLRQRLFG